MKRKIAVVTSSRADYGHLYWPLRDLAAHPEVDLKVIAMGPHLSHEFGRTIQEIERDGFEIAARIECLISSDTDVGMAKTIGVATLSLADALGAMRPDLLLLIADRYEMLAPASVALALRIPIAHIEGGEISEGAIDDAVRNALTKMAHVHFTSTELARRRVITLGEEEWRVHHAGAPSIDHLRRQRLLNREELESRLGIDLKRPTILVAYHPVTIAQDTVREADALFSALADLPKQILFCYPNADAGSRNLIERGRRFLSTRESGKVFVNLDSVTYWSLLKSVDLMIGNSSSGIMETPSLSLPTVNVGLRQQGRERAQNILDAMPEKNSILEKVGEASSVEFRRSLEGMTNPYGDGHATERIVKVLTTVVLGEKLLLKHSALPERHFPVQTESREMRIPLSAPDIVQADIDAVTKVLRTSRLSLGPKLEEFEQAFAQYIGTPFGIATNSGTTGLHLCIRALGIGEGDEVIVPSFAFVAAANAIRYERAIPVFAEIDAETLVLDPQTIEAAITPKTRAILVVHTFGCPAAMREILEIARRHRLRVIEDACEAFGAECDGERVGGLGDCGVFAFYPNKQITTGEGGMIVTRDSDIATRMRALRNQGRRDSESLYQHEELGYSYRLSEMNCALGVEQLKRIDGILARREAIAKSYGEKLSGNSDVKLISPPAGRRISWFVYVVRLSDRFSQSDRDWIVKEMARKGIGCGRYFAPIHLQPAYKSQQFPRSNLAITEHIAERCLALPFFNQITEEQIGEACETLNGLMRQRSARAAAG